MMKKQVLLIIGLLLSINIGAQKSQRIGYIDMDYILETIPSYLRAQNTLNDKVANWKSEVDKELKSLENMRKDFSNEKAILTKELIIERKEDINVKERDFKSLQEKYFGPEGKMYSLRRQLIQPIQDNIFNAVQTIAKKKKYDFIFDKSSDLLMLYANKKNDVSRFVIKLIALEQKKQSKQKIIANKKVLLEEKAKIAKEDMKAKKARLLEKQLERLEKKNK